MLQYFNLVSREKDKDSWIFVLENTNIILSAYVNQIK